MTFSSALLTVANVEMLAYGASVRAHTVVGQFSVSGGPHEGAA